MSAAVKLSEELVELAKKRGRIEHRSTPKQIELWAEVGRTVLDNPDLPVGFVLGTLEGLKEIKEGLTEPYVFD
jgi:ParD-like antitoxin of type II bacterial toxin-antitoxin system